MSFEVKSSVTITTVIKQGEVPVDLTEKQRIFYKNYEPMEGTFVPQWSSWLLSLSQFYQDLHNDHDHDGSQVSTLPVSLAASLSSSASSSSTNQSSSQCGRSARYFSQIYFMFYLFCNRVACGWRTPRPTDQKQRVPFASQPKTLSASRCRL